MTKKTNNKKENGVTIVILAVTIVVIFILTGVTTTMILGDGGILHQSSQIKNVQENRANEVESEVNSLINIVDQSLQNNEQNL